jgi:PadR family transcriptional regulator PadR
MKSLTQLEQHILLGIFHLKDNAYLITIREFLKKNTGKNHAIATIYVPLERLRKFGYLDTAFGGPSPKVGGRSIKYYHLTKAGFCVLIEMKKINNRMWLGFPEGATIEK